jgi:hypothetical protein
MMYHKNKSNGMSFANLKRIEYKEKSDKLLLFRDVSKERVKTTIIEARSR